MMNWASHWEHVVKTRQTERMAVGKTSELFFLNWQSVGKNFWGKGSAVARVAEQTIDRLIARCVRVGICIVAHQKTQGTPFHDSA